MLITQVIPESFQEFPDKISIVLFCYGCNFHCQNCYNYSFVTDKKNVKGTVEELLEKYQTPLVDAVAFIGGEPTIWKDDLICSVKHVKQKGLATKIFTNGFLSDVIFKLNQLVLVDAFSIDLKSVTNVKEILGVDISDDEYLARIHESIENILQTPASLEIRTTQLVNTSTGLVSTNIEEVQEYVKAYFPGIKHIIQKDFTENVSKLSR